MDISTDPAALLDLAYLQRFKHQPARCRGLIQAFLDSTEPILRQLEHAIQQQNEAEFRQILHALYGAAETVGATAMKGVCQQLVRQRRNGRRLAGISDIETRFRQTRAALLAFMGELPEQTERPAAPITAQATVLLVEDNPTSRELLHCALSDDYRLLDADNGRAALALCEGDAPPDAAIIDLNLGYSENNALSGLEVIQRLNGTIPVIVLTVDRSHDSIHAAVRAGAWAYLIKPPDPETLYGTLRTVIARAGDASNLHSHHIINIATGLMMAAHHLDQPEARRLIVTLAMAQRRKATDLAEEIVAAQGFQNTLGRAAQRLSDPTDGPPS